MDELKGRPMARRKQRSRPLWLASPQIPDPPPGLLAARILRRRERHGRPKVVKARLVPESGPDPGGEYSFSSPPLREAVPAGLPEREGQP